MGLFGLSLLTEVISYFYFRLILLPVFALASNCYCKVIYYFTTFTYLICTIIYLFKENSKTYPRIGFLKKLPYPRIRILPIPIRVSVSVLHRI